MYKMVDGFLRRNSVTSSWTTKSVQSATMMQSSWDSPADIQGHFAEVKVVLHPKKAYLKPQTSGDTTGCLGSPQISPTPKLRL